MWSIYQNVVLIFCVSCPFTNGHILNGGMNSEFSVLNSLGQRNSQISTKSAVYRLMDQAAIQSVLNALGLGRNASQQAVLTQVPPGNEVPASSLAMSNFSNNIPSINATASPGPAVAASVSTVSPHFFKLPTDARILGQTTRNNNQGGSLPYGAAGTSGRPAKPANRPFDPMLSSTTIRQNAFSAKMNEMLYNTKVSKMGGLMRLYEQEGCVNPVTVMPLKYTRQTKAVFANGCSDPQTENMCMMTQMKLAGNTPTSVGMQVMTYNMMSPQSKKQMTDMLNGMSPHNMMGGNNMMFSMGGEVGNPEMFEQVAMYRQKIFPLKCQEVTIPYMMFSVGTCCPGPVNIPQNVQLSTLLSAGSA